MNKTLRNSISLLALAITFSSSYSVAKDSDWYTSLNCISGSKVLTAKDYHEVKANELEAHTQFTTTIDNYYSGSLLESKRQYDDKTIHYKLLSQHTFSVTVEKWDETAQKFKIAGQKILKGSIPENPDLTSNATYESFNLADENFYCQLHSGNSARAIEQYKRKESAINSEILRHKNKTPAN